MKETSKLELKERVTNSFLKTISAFSNYYGGQIIFGVSDNGEILGLENPEDQKLNIENKINDSINPNPDYSLSIDQDNNTVVLTINPGKYRPYYYESKAYARNDTSTVEMDKRELQSMILESSNISYDSLESNNKELKFDYLEDYLIRQLGISKLNLDILKTLELYSQDYQYYTIAGELFSDNNLISGIDIARFGESINIILERKKANNDSILKQLEDSMNIYRSNYKYEKIEGTIRNKYEMIPETALREAIANALVHRQWDIDANIRISMYEDRIEIVSPGGLPRGISQEEYLNGDLSVIRNPIIANLFYRLDIIEKFGTGIRRIKESYQDSFVKPEFKFTENTIKVILPVIKNIELSKDQSLVLDLITHGINSSKEISERSKFSRTKVLGIIEDLIDLNIIEKTGGGRSTRYVPLSTHLR